MINFLQPLVLKTAIIVFALKCCSAKIDSNIATQSPPVSGSNTPEKLPENIYTRFKIANFTATVVESTIHFSWNIEEETNHKQKDSPIRALKIFENSKNIGSIAITIENACKIKGLPSLKCQYQYQKADCVNYQFILGGRIIEAFITTVPVKKNTTTFELTDNETNPVKLTWKIECNATSMYPVPVSITNNGKRVDHTVEAVCNSTHQICEIYLNQTFVVPCTSPIININGESVLLNANTIYSMNNKISVSNLNQIAVEWTEKTQITCPVPSTFNYKLVIKDDEKNQTAEDVTVHNWCNFKTLHRNSQRRQLNFNKNGQSLPCNGKENNFGFNSTLKSCVNYTVYVFRSEIGKPTWQTEVYKKSFVIKTLEPEDIQNLHVAYLSPSRFELQWEICAGCQKVENFTISILIDYLFFQNISLSSSSNTKCDDSAGTCTVTWMYDQNVTSCKQYFIHVGRSTIYLTTPPPGTVSFLADSSKSNNSSSFSVEWNVPKQCREPLTNLKTNESNENRSSLISSASANQTEVCSDEYCLMRWRFEKKLEPCTTYKLNLGSFTQDITTLPDFYGGIANNVTIRREVSESPDKSTTLVIRWDHPHCQKTKVLKWEISIRNSRTLKLSNATIVPISNLEYKFVGVEACETYSFAIQTIFENGRDFYSTEEEHFQSDCPVKLLVPISVIVGLLFIAIIIALFLSKKWKKRMGVLEKETDHNVNKLSSIDRRGKIPSMIASRFSSFSSSRNSYCDSRNISNENEKMDLNCLPQMTKRPMTIDGDIFSFDVGQARIEFLSINKLTEIEDKMLQRTIAERPGNQIKNRVLNTYPYDFNRVLLSQSEDDKNDRYINASFIPGFSGKEKEYIATQGPKDNTLSDFWQMILEQDVTLIVMVGMGALYECDEKKCERYWPNKDESVVYDDDIQLELLRETTYSFFTTRNILVTKAPDLKREIQQFHFTAWPDFETPDQPEEFIRFTEIVRRQARQWNITSPIVVHCSAGVGRTGTFIALDYLIQQVLITADLVDIPKTVRHLRRFRLFMVQSEEQYIFLYSCIAHYIKTRLSQSKEKI